MDAQTLKEMQAFPLDLKIKITEQRIREWHRHYKGQVYISFSGGKDSTILLDITRRLFPNVPALFVNTGLEYPEIRKFVDTIPNVTTVRPRMSFKQVIDKYGYPVVSKETSMKISRYRNTKREDQRQIRLHGSKKGKAGMIPKKWQYLIHAPFKISEKCCEFLKKSPVTLYERKTGQKPLLGMMAGDSDGRAQVYIKRGGCNSFETKRVSSWPLAVWVDSDIWNYIKSQNLPIAEIYNKGEKRTGCMFCMFGAQMEGEPNRFQRMAVTHPILHNYCINRLGLRDVLNFMKIPYKVAHNRSKVTREGGRQ